MRSFENFYNQQEIKDWENNISNLVKGERRKQEIFSKLSEQRSRL